MFRRITVLVLLAASLACAKSYHFVVRTPTLVGNTQLKPGEYTLKVDGSQVVLVDRSGEQVSTAARIETTDQTFSQTSVLTTAKDGVVRIESVALSGTHNKVVFD